MSEARYFSGLRMVVAISLLLSLIFTTAAVSIEASEYLHARVPRKLALLVGNYAYAALPDLPGVERDLKEMQNVFENLDFDVVDVFPNVKDTKAFQHTALVPFRKKVERDDLVIIYFSGHGFAYGRTNYIAPTDLPATVDEASLSRHAIPVDALVDFFDDEGPGAVMVIVDACRTIANFVIDSDSGRTRQKSTAVEVERPRSPASNYIIAMAVGPGKPATGSTSRDQMSVYTDVFVSEAAAHEMEFGELHNIIEFRVNKKTNSEQRPGLIDWSWSQIHLKITDELLESAREAWESVLQIGDPAAIEEFAAFNTLSPYVREARRWLAENGARKTTAISTVSPLGVELAWAKGTAVEALITGVAFPKVGDASGYTGTQLEFYGLQPSEQPDKVDANDLDRWTKLLAINRQEIVSYQTTDIYDRPRIDARIVETVEPLTSMETGNVASLENISAIGGGQSVSRQTCTEASGRFFCESSMALVFPEVAAVPELPIPGYPGPHRGLPFPGEASETTSWASVVVPGSKEIGYIPFDASTARFETQIGRPSTEVEVVPRAGGIRGLIDRSSITAAVDEIRASGKEVSWVSIAAPVTNEREERAAAFQLIYNAMHALQQLGVPQARISAVTNDRSVPAGHLRARFFSHNGSSSREDGK